jgi:hypothetical protein
MPDADTSCRTYRDRAGAALQSMRAAPGRGDPRARLRVQLGEGRAGDRSVTYQAVSRLVVYRAAGSHAHSVIS